MGKAERAPESEVIEEWRLNVLTLRGLATLLRDRPVPRFGGSYFSLATHDLLVLVENLDALVKSADTIEIERQKNRATP